MTSTTTPVQEAAPSARDWRRLRGITLIGTCVGITVILALAAYGWNWWSVGRYLQNTDDAYVGGDITVISAKVPGNIAMVAVTDNQTVHAGDLLVKLDDRDYRAALIKADSAIAAQQALLANLDATRALQQANIAQARAGVMAAAAETVRSSDDTNRYQNLVAQAAVSLQSAQRAEAEHKQAQANSQKAQAILTATERELDVIATRRQQAEAALAQARAERDIAQLNLGYTELRAPIDGIVGNRHGRSGAYAAAGAQLLSIVPVRGLWVDANFKESQIAKLKPGLSTTIEADVLPGHRFHGHIASIAPATGAQFSVLPPENATGNFTKIVQRVPVRILLDANDSLLSALRPGLSVEAEVDSRKGLE